MKKSKVILGGTAFLLAIAGAFATKASNKFNNPQGFTRTLAQAGHCNTPAPQSCFTKGATKCTTQNGRTVYTSNCVNTLFVTSAE